jgi:hypothetical protein
MNFVLSVDHYICLCIRFMENIIKEGDFIFFFFFNFNKNIGD